MQLDDFLKVQSRLRSERDLRILQKATAILMENINESRTRPWYPYRCIQPSSTEAFQGIWNWDSAFHSIGTANWDAELAKEQILGFIQYQCKDGMYVDFVGADRRCNDVSSKPPVLAWAAAKVYEAAPDLDFARKTYPSLVRNEGFWTGKRMYQGLFHYDANTNLIPFQQYDLNVRWESGWDNSVRWDQPCADYWAIDLNCFMVMTYRGLQTLAKALCEEQDALLWEAKEAALTDNIRRYLWNEEKGCYTDTLRFSKAPSNVQSPASFMPLYVGVATKEQAAQMAKLGGDKGKFYPGMPTVSYDDPQYSREYWRGNTWLNVAYFAAKGLKNYGFDKIADGIKETILSWIDRDGENVHENYDSTTGEGLYCPKFSWSCVFAIEFIVNW